VVTNVCGFPNFLRDSLFEKIDRQKSGVVTKA